MKKLVRLIRRLRHKEENTYDSVVDPEAFNVTTDEEENGQLRFTLSQPSTSSQYLGKAAPNKYEQPTSRATVTFEERLIEDDVNTADQETEVKCIEDENTDDHVGLYDDGQYKPHLNDSMSRLENSSTAGCQDTHDGNNNLIRNTTMQVEATIEGTDIYYTDGGECSIKRRCTKTADENIVHPMTYSERASSSTVSSVIYLRDTVHQQYKDLNVVAMIKLLDRSMEAIAIDVAVLFGWDTDKMQEFQQFRERRGYSVENFTQYRVYEKLSDVHVKFNPVWMSNAVIRGQHTFEFSISCLYDGIVGKAEFRVESPNTVNRHSGLDSNFQCEITLYQNDCTPSTLSILSDLHDHNGTKETECDLLHCSCLVERRRHLSSINDVDEPLPPPPLPLTAPPSSISSCRHQFDVSDVFDEQQKAKVVVRQKCGICFRFSRKPNVTLDELEHLPSENV